MVLAWRREVNAIAVVCVIWIVRRLLPDPLHRPTAVAAGLLHRAVVRSPSGATLV